VNLLAGREHSTEGRKDHKGEAAEGFPESVGSQAIGQTLGSLCLRGEIITACSPFSLCLLLSILKRRTLIKLPDCRGAVWSKGNEAGCKARLAAPW
jgi:hypothetical protein